MTEWRGGRFDDRTAAMLTEVARLTPDLPAIVVTQGSYSAGSLSAGTHAGGGAVDLDIGNMTTGQADELVAVMRRVGFAAWRRRPDQGFEPHIHGIAVGCSDLHPSAAAQVSDYRAGLNGLARRGVDDGPRDWVGVTFEQFQAEQAKSKAQEVAAMAANVWFMQSAEATVFVVDEGLTGKWAIPDPQVAADVAFIVRSAGGKVLTPPKGVPTGSVGGATVWAGVRPETLAAIPTR